MHRAFSIFVIAILLVIGSGCGKKPNIINMTSNSNKGDNSIKISIDGYDGSMDYELIDTFRVSDMKEAHLDVSKLDPYAYAVMANGSGSFEEQCYPAFLEDKNSGRFKSNCYLYVAKVKVMNINAANKYSDDLGYDSPYVFRADNISLSYIDPESKEIINKQIDYYSLRGSGDSTWCTYELKPGNTIEYDIGWILGEAVFGADGKLYTPVAPQNLYISNTTGSVTGDYYEAFWEER